MKKLYASILSIAMSLTVVAANAAEDPVGEWKGEGPRGEINITITKDDGGALAGKMITGRGPNDLSNVKLDGSELTFVNVLEFNGQSFELNFAGKIEGDTFTGTISTPRGENPITLTRAAGDAKAISGIVGLFGTWKLTGESQFGPLEHTLVVGIDGPITYASGGEVSEITNLKVDDNKVTFDMTVHGGGNAYDVSFEGSYDDEGLTGDMISNGSSFATLAAPRAQGLAKWAGTWELTGESRFGPMEHTLIIMANGKATYVSSGEVSELSDIEIDGNKISFNMTVFGGGNNYDVAFEGEFDSNNLTGDVITNGSSFAALRASKQ